MDGILAVGQIVDEQGDIRTPDTPAILRADLHRVGGSNDIFPTIPGDMVVHPSLQGLQQRGLSMIAAPYDEGDALGNPHTGNLSPVGQLQRHRQLRRGAEGHRVLHRQVGHAGGPGQNTPIRHKGAQSQPRQGIPDIPLVLRQVCRCPESVGGQISIQEPPFHTPGQQVKEDLLQLPGIDGAAIGRKAHLQPQQDIPGIRVQGTGSTLQHLLAAAAH